MAVEAVTAKFNGNGRTRMNTECSMINKFRENPCDSVAKHKLLLFLNREVYHGGLEGGGAGGDGTAACDDDHTLAEEGLALGSLEVLHRGLTAVVGADDTTCSLAIEIDHVFSPGTEVAVFVDHLGGDERGVLALIVL